MSEAKPYSISKHVVMTAYKRVKANRGTYGVDEQSIEEFERNRNYSGPPVPEALPTGPRLTGESQ